MSSFRVFECLVHLYDIKYKISLTDVHNNYVLFGELYPKIQQIDPKQDVSFETNTFEIFDGDANRFQRITSFSQVIENNSRIRVLIKPQLFKNYLSESSDERFDVLNSYQTTDYFNRNQSSAISGSHLTHNYSNTYNKMDFRLNNSQTKGSEFWRHSAAQHRSPQSLGQPMSPSFGPLVSPSMGSAIEPSFSGPSNSSAADWRTSSGYWPKVVDYDSNRSNSDLSYRSDTSLTNSYQLVSSNQLNVSSVINKLIESQNQLLKEKTLEDLRREGIEMKQNFNLEVYLCKVCDECFQTPDSALTHSRSTEHSENKLGIYADDLDRSLIIPSENLSDINVVLARKHEIKKLDTKTKYEFRRHGIRIKDGIGVNAYVCLECKVSFMSYNYVRHHLAKFKTLEEGSDVVYSSNTFHPGLVPFANQFASFGSQNNSSKQSSEANGENRTRKRRTRRKRRRDRERDRSPDSKRNRNEDSVHSREDSERRDGKVDKTTKGDDSSDLKREGIREKDLKNRGLQFVCQLCDRLLADRSLAINHTISDEHIRNKTGDNLRGIERLFVIDCNRTDIEYFLSRKRQLRTVLFEAMERYVYHGIRLKNGSGSEAFICLTCNKTLADLQTIEHHIEFPDIHRNIDLADLSGQSEAFSRLSQLSPLDLEVIFRNEGISLKSKSSESKRNEQFVCFFCETSFKTKDTVISHLSRPYHHKTKTGQLLRPIDANFTVPSDKSDEFDVAFARTKALYSLTNEHKIRYSENGIRLKDGIGSEAFVCLKCQLPIGADSYRTADHQIKRHIDSRQHIERLSV